MNLKRPRRKRGVLYYRLAEIAHALVILTLAVVLFNGGSVNSIPIDNSLIGAEIIRECFAGRKVDLAFLLDGSTSIGDGAFDQQKKFVSMIIERLDVAENATRIGIVQYSEEPRLEIGLTDYMEKRKLQWALNRIRYQTGATNTGRAIKFTADKLFAKGTARGDPVPKVVVVLTDGQSQDAVGPSAAQLRADRVLAYAVGVTDLINVDQLRAITGSRSRIFTVETFEMLDEPLSLLITEEMCRTEFKPGVPEIVCENDRIGVRARTKKPFDGHVFVKGHFNRQGCRRSADAFIADPTGVSIDVPFSECDVRRWRSLSPRGIYVEVTFIFMFHPVFMTKVDQAIKVQCFYMEADKTVEVPLEVSMLTTQFAEKVYPMPTCFYTLHLNTVDGPEIQYANIGDKVFHKWECIEYDPNYDTYGMLVHGCYVDDGSGDKVELIGADGCAIDVRIVGTPEYSPTLRVAGKQTHVFKYADRPLLQFQCQITVCIKYNGGCDGITPPNCKTKSVSRLRRALEDSDNLKSSSDITLDVLTNPIQVLEPLTASNPEEFAEIEWLNEAKEKKEASSQTPVDETCVTHTTLLFISVSIIVSYVLLAACIISVTFNFRRLSS